MERTLTILVVDDEQIVLESIQRHLRKDDFTVTTALSAKAGMNILDNGGVDIVLTDLMMPEIDGLEFMKQVKEKWPRLPVIMITGYATINTALQATQLGAFDYVAKPFTKSELKSVLQRASDLVLKTAAAGDKEIAEAAIQVDRNGEIKIIGENSWMMMQDDGIVLLGVERSHLHRMGRLQNIFLPSKGDKLRQGGAYLQIFSADLREHKIMSPLSGTVVEVNERVTDNPMLLLDDPYGDGWLVRLKPSNFEFEIKELGL